jgi:hypothetical protein
MCVAWCCLAALLLAAPARAQQADLGLKEPYKLHVVLHVAEHRFLTPIFQDEVRRQLGDLLRLTLKELAVVTVDNRHELLGQILARGLQQPLDGWDRLSDEKTHFVLIDYVDGQYRIRARQHDGLTGLPSPVVREERTGDRRLVARKAARLVNRDFGLAGTVVETGEHDVKVALRGGALGVDLSPWIREGAVFAVARVRREGNRRRSARVESALLQAVDRPAEGICRCRYFHRYAQDRLQEPGPEVVYRCLQQATTTTPLRLRLLDRQTFAPLVGLQVNVSGAGFSGPFTELTTGPDGLAVSPKDYSNVAFVQIKNDGQTLAQIPVEIVADRTVVCRVSVKEEDGTRTRLVTRAEGWLRRIYEDLRLSNSRVTELNARLAQSLDEALRMAREGLKGLSREIEDLAAEHDALESAARQVPGAIDLTEGEQRLRELRDQRKQLEDFIAQLEETQRQNEKTRALKTLLQRVTLLESQADFPGAIALLEKIVQENPKEAEVHAHLEQLRKDWAIRSDQHKKAREFIYDVWPKKMDTAVLKENLAKAWDALHTCEKVGDKLSPQKMLPADLAHAGRLKERLEVLRRTPDREDARNEARAIGELAEELRKLHAEASAYVHKGKAGAKAAPAKTAARTDWPAPLRGARVSGRPVVHQPLVMAGRARRIA